MSIFKRIVQSPVLLILAFTILSSCVFTAAMTLIYRDISLITSTMQTDIRQSSKATQQIYEESVSSLMQLVESISIDPLLNVEPETLNDILIKVRQNKAVKNSFFVDEEEKILADGASADDNPLLGKDIPQDYQKDIDIQERVTLVAGNELIYSTPFDDQGDRIGRLQVVFSLDKIREIENSLLTKADTTAKEKRDRGLTIIIGTIIFVIIGLAFISFFTRRLISAISKLVTNLNNSSLHIAKISDEISEVSESLAKEATTQASSLEETSASLVEMSSMTNENAVNSSQADNLMKGTHQVIHSTSDVVSGLANSMTDIRNSSNEISSIIQTIESIAFQTNLLALNAAVEAARAGSAGAGFAVVADEVRNLALRASEAAQGTAGLIQKTVSKINQGSDMVIQTSEAFEEVDKGATKVVGIVHEISAASSEQALGIEQINKAVVEMDQVAQKTSSYAEDSSSSSSELSTESLQLQNYVVELRLLTLGK